MTDPQEYRVPPGFALCGDCGDPTLALDLENGVCLACSDGRAWTANAARAASVAPDLRAALAPYADEQSAPWLALERAIWPNGPASGSGSGAYSAFKARLAEKVRAALAAPSEPVSGDDMSVVYRQGWEAGYAARQADDLAAPAATAAPEAGERATCDHEINAAAIRSRLFDIAANPPDDIYAELLSLAERVLVPAPSQPSRDALAAALAEVEAEAERNPRPWARGARWAASHIRARLTAAEESRDG